MKNWIKNRIGERTSWDGAVCVALGLMILFMAPLAKIVDLRLHGVSGQFGRQSRCNQRDNVKSANVIVTVKK